MNEQEIKLPELPELGPAWTDYWKKNVHEKMQDYARQAVRMNVVAATQQQEAAVATLEAMGYTYNGGQQWKPPMGEAPDYIKDERRPFALEAAKRGEPLVTRDGRSAKFVAYVPEAEKFSVVAFVEGASGVGTFANNGRYHADRCDDSVNDLFMAPKPKRTVWVNFYRRGLTHAGLTAGVFESQKVALHFQDQEDAVAIAVPVQIDA